jgi:integrase
MADLRGGRPSNRRLLHASGPLGHLPVLYRLQGRRGLGPRLARRRPRRSHAAFLDTKNGESRGIYLHPRAMAAMANLKHRQGAVFRRPDGKTYETKDDGGGQIKTAFNGACRRAGIGNFHPHDCRHTWATWHYAANRDLRALMELGGWKSIAMVQRYTHINAGHLAASVLNIGEERPGNMGAGRGVDLSDIG